MLFQSLNPQQKQAVLHTEGPLVVVAGAGSGKTRVIASRIAYLIGEKNVPPGNILAITFTNKAAREMRDRVGRMLAPEPAGPARMANERHGGQSGPGLSAPGRSPHGASPWIGTFHSFCLRVLRQDIGQLGYSNDFVVFDGQDQLSLVKQCMKTAGINDDAFPPKAILNHISGFKNDFLLPKDVDPDSFAYGNKAKAAGLYPRYQEELRKNNALDFDDLLIMTVRLLRESETAFQHYSGKFRYVLVDEFQDTNVPQYLLVRQLSKTHNNVCVVGDDDQSIYRWRGANVENILNFEKDFPGAALIKLEENYRSTRNILKAAGAVVSGNLRRTDKTLWTRNEEGSPVVYYRADDEDDEARFVCERVLRLNREEGYSFNEMAVLYRTNAQSRAVEDQLRRQAIPYQVVGGLRFYERKEIKDILAFMRVALNASDSVSLQRIINVPPRGIGKTSLDKVTEYCSENRVPLFEGLRLAGEKRLVNSATARKMAQFVSMVEGLERVYRDTSLARFLDEILECTGYERMLREDLTFEGKNRLENVKELYSALEKFAAQDGQGSLKDFLDSASLVSDADNIEDTRGTLPLMTLHTCKGLEFEGVFIVGMENGLIPHASSMSDNEEYEEERRLCYVGFTRARKRLFLTNARRRRIYGSTFNYPASDFLLALPPETLEKEPGREVPGDGAGYAYSGNDRSATPPPSHGGSPGQFPVGAKVLHPAFGSGVVVQKEGEETDLRVVVFFKTAGKKKLAVNHANLIVL